MKILCAAIAICCIAGCSSSDKTQQATTQSTTQTAAKDTAMNSQTPAYPGEVTTNKVVTTGSGLMFIDMAEGTGASPNAGDQVTVHYTGYLMDGKKFDSSVDRNQPFTFTIGRGQVIKGWDEGVMSMKIGGRRKLIIPPELGYGSQSVGGGLIPPNSQLVFDVSLLDAK
jgi:peptidylprolyl isomerase